MNKARRPAMIPLTFALLGVSLAGFASPSQAPAKPARAESARFQVTQAPSKIEVDGVLDEEAWAAAPAIPLPFEW